MKSITKLIAVAMVLPTAALAGEWSSGGGAVLRDANNPWFLENTKEVSYCIKSDNKSFADLPTPLPEIVEKALSFWKKQMRDVSAATNAYAISKDPTSPFASIEVASQKFTYASKCTGKEDIAFQFAVADSKQRKFFSSSKNLIGAAVRTDYDEVQLRAKGFIYVAADSGLKAYQGEHLRPRAWHEGKGGLLFRALVHELGHVFGLSHGTEGVMSEYYTESLLRDHSVPKEYSESFDLPSIFHFELSAFLSAQLLGSEACEKDYGKKIFGSDFHCPFISLKQDGPDGFLLVMKPSQDGEEKIIGRLDGKTILRVPGHGFGVNVVLTDRQNVFSSEASKILRLRGPSVHMGRFVGKFTPTAKDGKSFTAILILSPEAVTFDGFIDGSYVTNIMNWSFSSLGNF